MVRFFLAFLMPIVLVATQSFPQKEFYIDIPYSGPASLKPLVDQGVDLVGIDQDKK